MKPPIVTALTLGAYRGIVELTLRDLSAVNLIVGANNAGKSSILEAVGLVLRPPDPGQWVSAVRRRDADLSLVDGVWSMFPAAEGIHPEDGPQHSTPILLHAALANGARLVHATAQATEVPGLAESGEFSVRVDVAVDGEPPIELRFPGIKPVIHQVPLYRVFTVSPASHYTTSALVELLSQVIDAGRKQLAIQLMQVFDREIEDLDVIKSHGREAVRVTHARRGIVDMSSFGDGVRRTATLALTLSRASQGVLLIDEIEAGIHHSVLREVLGKLLAAADEAQVQVIATTHSLEAVDALVGAVMERDAPDALAAYWMRQKDGSREVRRYDAARLQRMREGGLDVR